MAEKQVRVGVGVFVIRDGKFLMGLRQGSHGADRWALPGGHQEFRESFEQTARREIQEETGLEITNIRFGAVTNDFFPDEDKHYITVWMLSNCSNGEPQNLEPHKCKQLGWFTFETLPKPLFLPLNHLLESEFIDNIKQVFATKH